MTNTNDEKSTEPASNQKQKTQQQLIALALNEAHEYFYAQMSFLSVQELSADCCFAQNLLLNALESLMDKSGCRLKWLRTGSFKLTAALSAPENSDLKGKTAAEVLPPFRAALMERFQSELGFTHLMIDADSTISQEESLQALDQKMLAQKLEKFKIDLPAVFSSTLSQAETKICLDYQRSQVRQRASGFETDSKTQTQADHYFLAVCFLSPHFAKEKAVAHLSPEFSKFIESQRTQAINNEELKVELLEFNADNILLFSKEHRLLDFALELLHEASSKFGNLYFSSVFLHVPAAKPVQQLISQALHLLASGLLQTQVETTDASASQFNELRHSMPAQGGGESIISLPASIWYKEVLPLMQMILSFETKASFGFQFWCRFFEFACSESVSVYQLLYRLAKKEEHCQTLKRSSQWRQFKAFMLKALSRAPAEPEAAKQRRILAAALALSLARISKHRNIRASSKEKELISGEAEFR